jgi:hypothetical protein
MLDYQFLHFPSRPRYPRARPGVEAIAEMALSVEFSNMKWWVVWGYVKGSWAVVGPLIFKGPDRALVLAL